MTNILINFLKGKVVLVTGGTGSIGSSIVKEALSQKAKLVKVFSNDENGQYELEKEIGDNKTVSFHLGDVRDEARMNSIVKDVELVFHAAALKHVDRCELNPFEAVATNILGTKNLINSCIQEKVKKVIFISTDKAVNPVSVMGATKLLAEKLINAESLDVTSSTIFSTVRFGNVLNTRGSILPSIKKQIQNGGPITLTDERMIRFFMTKDDAVDLIISASKLAKGGETFVLKMPIIRLKDLFDSLKELYAPKYGFKPSSIKTKIIGAKPGEKFIEELITEIESRRVLETKKFFIILPYNYKELKYNYPNSKMIKNISLHNKNKPLGKKNILKILKKNFK